MNVKVKLKNDFHRDFLVTLKGHQFLKNEVTTVDTNDAEVQAYLLTYEKYIEIIEEKKEETSEEKEARIKAEKEAKALADKEEKARIKAEKKAKKEADALAKKEADALAKKEELKAENSKVDEEVSEPEEFTPEEDNTSEVTE